MRRWAVLACVLGYICLFLGGALMGFERVTLDSRVYDRLQADLDVYEETGISAEALPRVTRVLAEYLRDEREDISIEEEVFAVRGEVFNEDEKAHMVDVKNLFLLEKRLRIGLLLAGAALLALAMPLARGQIRRTVWRGIGGAALALALAGAAAAVLWLTSGFNRLFIAFHRALFSNDLWLMDPRTDAMIRMLPTAFFQRITAMAGMMALLTGGMVLAAGWLIAWAVGRLTDERGGGAREVS